MKTCPECYSEYEDALDECPTDSTTLRAVEKDPLVGARLADRYEIVSVIGRGGMGVVYKARQEIMDRLMAIKMLHSHMVSEPESVKRFYREAKTVSQVRHHHIITLYDFGMSKQGQPYIVMDYLEGTSLKMELKEGGPLAFERADQIFKQVVEGLQAAHDLDVVHRDLKPENIMLTKQPDDTDWVTLVDFGLSKLKETKTPDNFHITKVGEVCGSPPYMSPEQCLSSRVVDPRSDIYSLAVVVYESLANKLPFNVKSAIEMLDCHLYATPIPLNQAVPELKSCTEVARVLNKALQKDTEKRHQTVFEFGEELHEAFMRDSLKLRALKHRVEVATLQGMMNEVAGVVQQSTTIPKDMSSLLDGVQFLREQASIEVDQQKASYTNARVVVGDGASGADESGDYTLDNCPYCDAPLHKDLKFCLNCQRQLVSPQELQKLRTAQGRHIFPKGKRGLQNEPASHKVNARTKELNLKAMKLATIQQVLRVVLILVVGYACWAGLVANTNNGQLGKFSQMIQQKFAK